jgi:hypothetical protein
MRERHARSILLRNPFKSSKSKGVHGAYELEFGHEAIVVLVPIVEEVDHARRILREQLTQLLVHRPTAVRIQLHAGGERRADTSAGAVANAVLLVDADSGKLAQLLLQFESGDRPRLVLVELTPGRSPKFSRHCAWQPRAAICGGSTRRLRAERPLRYGIAAT